MEPGARPSIGVVGSYGGLNGGDEAILTVVLRQLEAAVPGAAVTVFSRDPTHTGEQHGVRALPVRALHRDELRAAVGDLDLLLLGGGGGILYDSEAEHYLRVARAAQARGVPTATFAVGVGPLARRADRLAVCEVLSAMDRLTVRDSASGLLLEELGVDPPVRVTADPALLLEAEPFTDEMLRLEGIPTDRPLVGVSVRERGEAAAAVNDRDYHALLAVAADFIVDRFGAELVFVPMERGDIRESHRVMADMTFGERAFVIKGAHPPARLLGLMGRLELVVGMRLHVMIFAALAGVLMHALPYASKVGAFLEALQVPAPPLLHRDHAGVLLAAIDRLWDERADWCARLPERLAPLRASAAQTARLVVEPLARA